MTSMLITFLVAAVIVGIFLRSALHALGLVALVLGLFFISCYAFDVSPRAILSDGVREAHHEYRALHVPAHKREIREWL